MIETALVTGGAKRIGRALALALADHGYRIALHYRSSEEAARETADEITSAGGRCELFQADLGCRDDVLALVPKVAERCPDLAVLVNNASIFEKGPLAETEPDQLDRHLAVNLAAPLLLMRDFARVAGRGHIINLLDQRITKAEPDYFAYTLTKKALAEATEMAARELGPEVRVNGICPGLILPPPGKDRSHLERMAGGVPMQRVGGPEDIVAAASYLLENAYLTGQLIFVDGGEHLT